MKLTAKNKKVFKDVMNAYWSSYCVECNRKGSKQNEPRREACMAAHSHKQQAHLVLLQLRLADDAEQPHGCSRAARGCRKRRACGSGSGSRQQRRRKSAGGDRRHVPKCGSWSVGI